MHLLTLTDEFQIAIPPLVREHLCLVPGQKIRLIEYQGRIELIPERDISGLRGFVKGIHPCFEREKDRL
jgi:AbrB family looped-hinge helix DNA binding protein